MQVEALLQLTWWAGPQAQIAVVPPEQSCYSPVSGNMSQLIPFAIPPIPDISAKHSSDSTRHAPVAVPTLQSLLEGWEW